MNVLVAGGRGFLGAAIVEAARAGGHAVTILSREGGGTGAAASVGGDVTNRKSLAGKLGSFEVVVDAVQFPNSPIEDPRKGYTFERVDLGGTRNLVEAAKEQGVRQFVGLSGAGAAEQAKFHWLRYKWQEEEAIKASGVGYTIFRPSWVYGPRDVSLNRFLGLARFLPFVPVIGNGKMRLNPVFVGDVAAHVVASFGNTDALGRTFEIGGPEVLTMDEIVRTALRVAGKRRFLLHQPTPVMKVVAGVAQHLPGRPLTPGAIDFITMDPVVDTAELRATFGLRLTPLAEGLGTYLGRGATAGVRKSR